MKIGKLIEVDVRDLWKHEQYDFSNWLSQEENIELINEIIGLTLVDIEKEVFVGSYRCDLVAKDETTETTVIIENQLEISNHDHLGKIVTYASGLSADVIVWIVKEARPEHRSAIEWLNNHTSKKINFFLLELHAYKIGESIPAPKFEVIEMPNDFIKNLNTQNRDGSMNKSQSERLTFWTEFNNLLSEKGKPFNPRKATTDHWYSVSIGTSAAYIDITLVNKENYIGVGPTIPDNKELFDKLYNNKEKIEAELGFSCEWNRLDNKKASRIMYRINGLEFDNHSNYRELMSEIIEKVTIARAVFAKYIKQS